MIGNGKESNERLALLRLSQGGSNLILLIEIVVEEKNLRPKGYNLLQPLHNNHISDMVAKQFVVIFKVEISSKYFDIHIMINGQVDLGTIPFLIYNRETNLCRGSNWAFFSFPQSPPLSLSLQQRRKQKTKRTTMSSEGEVNCQVVLVFFTVFI